MQREGVGDAFETGPFLPAGQVVAFPDVLSGYSTSEALLPYLAEGEHRHVDEDRHLLDEEAMRLDAERLARDVARYHAVRHVARDERARLGDPNVRS
ncbi:hypothetical protein ACRCUN_30115 [Mycobacterium sp. LTG2003]